MKKQSKLATVAVHSTLLLLVVWSVTPFLWTVQTSIKFTRDVAAKDPVFWGYETTAKAYNSFWLDDEDINMWHVLLFILGVAVVAAALGMIGRRMDKGWPWYLASAGVIALALNRFPTIWEVDDEYRFLINSVVVTVLTMLISLSIGKVGADLIVQRTVGPNRREITK